YEITITDNGVGFDPEKPLSEIDTHIGIENVRDRLWSLCEGTLTIESNVGAGTVAIISLPKGKLHL
ncbi:MAG: sensor histidine kinase, partial [Oscillospiraceae bacterium]